MFFQPKLLYCRHPRVKAGLSGGTLRENEREEKDRDEPRGFAGGCAALNHRVPTPTPLPQREGRQVEII